MFPQVSAGGQHLPFVLFLAPGMLFSSQYVAEILTDLQDTGTKLIYLFYELLTVPYRGSLKKHCGWQCYPLKKKG